MNILLNKPSDGNPAILKRDEATACIVHLNNNVLRNGSFDFVEEIHGDTIADVLSYVEYHPQEIQRHFRDTAERAVRDGRITARERQAMIKTFTASMQGYTYYEKEN